MTTIAFIGLGNMGLPMAKNLINAGHEVHGFDLSQAQLDALKEAGGIVAASAAAAVATADAVVTMLPAGRHVQAAYTGADGILSHVKPGALLIDSSTIDVATARAVIAAAGESGFAMVDAPVSGGVGGAAAGTLTFMVGGSEDAFNRAKPILEVMGKTIVHCGDAGTGQAAKLCNNMMLGIQMISVCEGFKLAAALGLEPQKLFDVSSTASAACWSLNTYCPVPGPVPTSPANKDYAPGFMTELMLKDMRLALDAANATGATVPLAALVTNFYALSQKAGNGKRDFSSIIEMLDDGTG